MTALSAPAMAAVRTALLAWYDTAARPLPWRTSRDPYEILVSEIMSQQTRVDTVIPYYERWIRRFPDVDALADAPGQDVLKAWEGLGYYSRARNLHAAARLVRERHAGDIPDTYDELRALPGVGEYTAGAVASIAFGARHAAVDGNVRRVLARLLDEPAPSPALLRDTALSLVPGDRPGDFNQAVMELGATLCTPRSPRCTRCPIAAQCAARAAGTQEDRPARTPKKDVPVIDVACAVVHDAGRRMLLVQRPAHGLLAGMWAFPGAEMGSRNATDVAAALAREYAPDAASARPLGTVRHTFSHRREHYHCVLFSTDATSAAADAACADSRNGAEWIEPDAEPPALPRAQQKIRALALAALDDLRR